MNQPPAPDPGPTPDPTPFFSDFKESKMQKKFIFLFFLITYPQANYLNVLLKFCFKILFCEHYFSLLNTLMRKGKDPDPYLWLMDPDPDGPKTCGSCRSGSRSQTILFLTSKNFSFVHWHYCTSIRSRTCGSSITWKLNLVTTANKQRNCGKNSKNCADLFPSRRCVRQLIYITGI